jgi:LuxR family maltose regulon positive regulatory protein
LFVVSLDEQGEWYRYHHLFSELLLYELRSAEPELVPNLRGRASVWLEGEGYMEGAIRQAVAAADFERAGLLIARHWYGYAVTGHSATVERWLESLPDGTIVRNAALCLVEAWLCALDGRREECEEYLTLADGIAHAGPLPDGTASVESGAANLRAVFGFGGVGDMVEAARRADALGLDRTSPQAPLVKLGQGTSWYFSGNIAQARRALEGGLRLTNGGHPIVRMGMLTLLSLIAGDEGLPEEAESHAREALALVDRYKLRGIPQATLAPIALGRALAGRGKLEEAQEELENACSARRRLPGLSPWPTLVGLLALAQARTARGDRAEARATLAEARAILEAFPDAGTFPELLERQERELRARKPREGQLDGELTERELDVLRLLCGELSTRQMAHSLYVAPSTVRTQIKSIYRKLGTSSRSGAVEEARARGLL